MNQYDPPLCQDCEEKMFPSDIGTCSVCGAETSSSAFAMCAACAAKRKQCAACGKKI